MLMGILHSICGMLQLHLTCADPLQLVKSLENLDIRMNQVQLRTAFDLTFWVSRKDAVLVENYARKMGIRVESVARWGVYWLLQRFLKRKLAVSVIAVLFVLSILLPNRVLFLSVEGNHRIPAQKILEAAAENGVSFGALRRTIRSEETKNSLLAAVPELQWVGINTKGSHAIISVRERAETEPIDSSIGISNVIAVRDGVVVSATATAGTCLCAPGDVVKAGQTLISAYTDCSLALRATRAQGEIFAQTQRRIQIVMPATRQMRTESKDRIQKFSLQIGKNRINFYKGSGIYDGSCVKMYSKYVLTLPGGFALPVAWIREEICTSDLVTESVPETAASAQLQMRANRYLIQTMVAGSILTKTETLAILPERYRLSGRYVCREMIGREREEQIGEFNGKIDGADRECRPGR